MPINEPTGSRCTLSLAYRSEGDVSLFPTEFVSLAVCERQPKQIELAALVHLELHETARPRCHSFGYRREAAIRRKACGEDISVPGLQLELGTIVEFEYQRIVLVLQRRFAKTRIGKTAGQWSKRWEWSRIGRFGKHFVVRICRSRPLECFRDIIDRRITQKLVKNPRSKSIGKSDIALVA
jgi:hypothetical protein